MIEYRCWSEGPLRPLAVKVSSHLQTFLGEDRSAAPDAAQSGHVGQYLPARIELVRAKPDVRWPEPMDLISDIIN